MEFENIKVFLAIVDQGSIARAADYLHIVQSAASNRLKDLEMELGIPLILRQQGVRRISLTEYGENFLIIARQWQALERQAYGLKSMKSYKQLRIASTDFISKYVFADLYPWFINNHPDIELYLQTEHATEIHQLIESQKIDAGFAFNLHLFPNVVSLPIYKDKFVIVCHKNNKFLITNDEKDLNPQDEIYLKYSDSYETWHQSVFQSSRHHATLGTLSMLPHFLNYPNTWSIIPHSAADILTLQHNDLQISALKHHIPYEQIAYLIYNKNCASWIKDLIKLFLIDTCKVLQSSPVQLLINDKDINSYFN